MNTTTNIAIANLHPFEGHPYQVRDDAEMDALVESIREHGILTPLIVRPLEDAPMEYKRLNTLIHSIEQVKLLAVIAQFVLLGLLYGLLVGFLCRGQLVHLVKAHGHEVLFGLLAGGAGVSVICIHSYLLG